MLAADGWLNTMINPLSQPWDQSHSALPLIVGVTGHRDILDIALPELEKIVRGIFTDLEIHYRDTPIILLSSLAEGADRLVARVALESGTRLWVPLPMPRLIYERDFRTDASRAEFDALISRADHCLVISWADNSSAQLIESDPAALARQY